MGEVGEREQEEEEEGRWRKRIRWWWWWWCPPWSRSWWWYPPKAEGAAGKDKSTDGLPSSQTGKTQKEKANAVGVGEDPRKPRAEAGRVWVGSSAPPPFSFLCARLVRPSASFFEAQPASAPTARTVGSRWSR